ncbi:MAG: hypothetical protein QOK05_2567 [Chloroflexota bacterium]|jgi:hypothetical protein|nr:hypothetical protein [Chloroflexota bacterium]
MNDFENDLKRQLAREADAVQSVPRDLAARIAESSGPRPALWLRMAPIAVAVLFVGAVGLAMNNLLRTPPIVPSPAGTPSVLASDNPAPSPAATPSPVGNLGAFACGQGGNGGRQVVQPSADGSGNLTAVRVAHQAGFDRVTFEFAGATLPAYTITLQATTHFTQDASGMPVDLRGSTGLKVVFHGGSEMDLNGKKTYSGSNDLLLPAPSAKGIAEVRQFGDFERVLSWGMGLDALPVCTRVLPLASPTRLVVDVQQQP